MNTLKILALAATVAALSALQSAEASGKTTTEVGQFSTAGGDGAVVQVITEAGRKSVVIYTHDKHVIASVYMRIPAAKAKELRQLLDDAITEAEKPAQ